MHIYDMRSKMIRKVAASLKDRGTAARGKRFAVVSKWRWAGWGRGSARECLLAVFLGLM